MTDSCQYLDIQNSFEEFIDVPKCEGTDDFIADALSNLTKVKDSNDEQWGGCSTETKKQSDKQQLGQDLEQPYIKSLSDRIRAIYTELPFKWDDSYSKILVAINLRRNQTGISEFVGLGRGTVQNRLDHLIQCNIVTEMPIMGKIILGGRQTLYAINSRLLKLIGTTEEALAPTVFDDAHNLQIYFRVLKGNMPKNGEPYQLTNWGGYWFYDENKRWKVQTIEAKENAIRIYLLEEVPGKDMNTINMRAQLKAVDYAMIFAERYHLQLGLPEASGQTEYVVKESPPAKSISEIGVIKIGKEISMDKSRSSGDAEHKGTAAQEYQRMIQDWRYVESMVAESIQKNKCTNSRFRRFLTF